MTNISSEYNRGYRQALLDAIEFFGCAKEALNVSRRHLNDSRSMALLKFMLDNRIAFREHRNYTVIWNNETDKPEFVVEGTS